MKNKKILILAIPFFSFCSLPVLSMQEGEDELRYLQRTTQFNQRKCPHNVIDGCGQCIGNKKRITVLQQQKDAIAKANLEETQLRVELLKAQIAALQKPTTS